jgi:ligand-binding sensor domain-containing protein
MKKISIFLIFSLFPLFVFGQEYWENMVVPEQVNDVLETSSTIWMATNGGLVAVDKQSKAVSQFTKTNGGLPSNRVEGVAIDNSGNLWIGTYSMNLAKYNGTSWTSVPYPTSFPSTIKTHSIRFDQNNVLWAGTSHGLVKYDGTNWDLFNVSSTGVNFFFDAWDIEIDAQGNIYTVSSNVIRFNGTTWEDISTSGISSYGGAHTEMLSNGTFVFGNLAGNIVALYDTAWTVYKSSNGDFPTGGVKAISADANGNLYIAIKGHGVFKLQNGVWVAQTLPSSSLDALNLSSMFADSNNNLWLANKSKFVKINSNNTTENIDINTTPLQSNTVTKTYHKGNDVYVLEGKNLNYYKDNVGWSTLTVPYSSVQLNSNLSGIAVKENGHFWCANYGGTLSSWNGQSWSHFSYLNSSLPICNINDLAWDEASQTLWLATSAGLIKYKNQQFSIYDTNNTMLNNNDIKNIQLVNGSIYLSAREYVYKLTGTTWTNLTPTALDYVVGFLVDNAENIWIGHWTKGVLKYENSTWTSISDLQDARVTTIKEDNNGNYYFGTLTQGVIYFDSTWTNLNEDNSKLSDNEINHLSIDGDNNLWISTEVGGVTIYRPSAPVSDEELEIVTATNFSVFPNPIVEQATIEFTLNNSQNVALGIYDINGRLLKTIIPNENRPAGKATVNFSKGELASGIYFIKLELANSIHTIKVLMP